MEERAIRGAARKPVWRVTSPVCLYSCSTLSHMCKTPPPLCWSLRAPASCSLGTPTPFQTQKASLFFFKNPKIHLLKNHILTALSQNHPLTDEEDEEFSDNQLLRLPPVGPPSWDSNVVCIQPTRNLSRPEGHEDSEEKQNNSVRLTGVIKHLIDCTPSRCFTFMS